MRADIVPGAKFPDYELTDHTKTRRRLSELQGIDPMILILSRGHYCPKIIFWSQTNFVMPLGRNGPFFRILGVRYSKTWIFKNIRTLSITR